jgi:two-component system sensor histidine kinase MprB
MTMTLTFRRRIVALAAAAVAGAIALAAISTYIIVRHELRAQVDDTLRNAAPNVVFTASAPGIAGAGLLLPPRTFGDVSGSAQATLPGGDVLRTMQGPSLPTTAEVRAVAAGRRGPFLSDERVNGVHMRVFTSKVPGGGVLQVARPLTETDNTLTRLRLILLTVTLAGIGLAGALGFAVSRVATKPLAELTAAAERVAQTGDLRHRLDPDGRHDDEPGRLAAAFNAMLQALESSREAQRQLVADASHELRTPLTAVRANIELLDRAHDLPAPERHAAVASAREQLEDLTVLVGDLVDLARPGAPPPANADVTEELALDALVTEAVERARLHAPATEFVLHAEPCEVHGCRDRLARAISNLLDNAVKWSPPGAPVEVEVSDGEVRVRDHGPGIAAADLPHVFDRFYRAPAARGLPGSGLGLAIVKHVADAHGGTVSAEAAPGGGALLRMAIPSSSTSSAPLT